MEIINEKKSVAAALFWADIQKIIAYIQEEGKKKWFGYKFSIPKDVYSNQLGKYFENLKINVKIVNDLVYNGETFPNEMYYWTSYEEERLKEPDKANDYPDKMSNAVIELSVYKDLNHDGLEIVLVHEINHLWSTYNKMKTEMTKPDDQEIDSSALLVMDGPVNVQKLMGMINYYGYSKICKDLMYLIYQL